MDTSSKKIISFYKLLNSSADSEKLIIDFFELLKPILVPDRLLLLKALEDINQFTVSHECTEKKESLLSVRINGLSSLFKNVDSKAIILEDLNDDLLKSYKINSLLAFPLDEKKLFLTITYSDSKISLSTSEIELITDLSKEFKNTLVKIKDTERKNEELTRLKLQNEILREQEILRMDFLNNISHELKNPLSSILGFSKILISKKNIAESKEEIINHMHESSLRLSNLVNDLSQVTKPINGWVVNKTMVDVKEIIERSIKEFTTLNKDFKITFNSDSNISPIKSDSKLIRQLVDNLISNALKYSIHKKEININLEANNNKIFISISDHGVGISDEEIPKLFDRYFRSSNPAIKDVTGSGLGLAICKEISLALGGDIGVESKLGSGSKFTISLPIV